MSPPPCMSLRHFRARIAERRANPGDDSLTSLTAAEEQGRVLDEQELQLSTSRFAVLFEGMRPPPTSSATARSRCSPTPAEAAALRASPGKLVLGARRGAWPPLSTRPCSACRAGSPSKTWRSPACASPAATACSSSWGRRTVTRWSSLRRMRSTCAAPTSGTSRSAWARTSAWAPRSPRTSSRGRRSARSSRRFLGASALAAERPLHLDRQPHGLRRRVALVTRSRALRDGDAMCSHLTSAPSSGRPPSGSSPCRWPSPARPPR